MPIVDRDWLQGLPESFQLLSDDEKKVVFEELTALSGGELSQLEYAEVWERLCKAKVILASARFIKCITWAMAVAMGLEADVDQPSQEHVFAAAMALQGRDCPAGPATAELGPWTDSPLALNPKWVAVLHGARDLAAISKRREVMKNLPELLEVPEASV